jgi:PAS domain S-box-containing protein
MRHSALAAVAHRREVMNHPTFEAQVRATLDRVELLRQKAETARGPLARAVLVEALEMLAVTVEELRVAREELRVQNETLAEANAAAAAERNQYQDLFEFAPNGYLVTDPEGVVLESNRAARELLQAPGPWYFPGKPLSVFVRKEDRELLHRQLTALQRGEPAWNQTLRFQPRTVGAEPLVMEVSVVPFRDVETRQPRLRWQLRDVTAEHRTAEELRRANEQLEARVRERTAELERALAENQELVARLREVDRRKDEFLGVIAHELRGPLTPIRNAVSILGLRGPLDPTLQQARDMIDRQAVQLNQLIEDLLDVTRIIRGTVRLSPEPIDLMEAAGRAVEAVRGSAKDRGVRLRTTEPAEPIRVWADPGRLDQVLGNLLVNAVKFTDCKGEVTVEVSRETGRGVVRVRDTGIGIAPDLLPRVFDLFRQGESARDQNQGGLGIGLYVVKQLVEWHGGTVEAHSAGPGAGSEFVVRLPETPAGQATVG